MADIYVSVFMLTYNQENFIAQTIESVLMQETNFRVQLVIGEDCSSDATRKICEGYASEFPEKIKLLPSEKNLGLIENFIRTFKQCTGKYIAVCDGDDYWTDPLKLQKQVDFLEHNPNYSIVYTQIEYLYPSGEKHLKVWPNVKEPTTFNDLIFSNHIPSVSVLFKNIQKEDALPAWIGKFPYGDWPIYLWTTRNGGKIKYMAELTAVYRKEIGVSEKLGQVSSAIAKVNLEIVQCVHKDPLFQEKKKIIAQSLRKHELELMAIYFREQKFLKSVKIGGKLLAICPLKVVRTYLYLIKRGVEKRQVQKF